MKRLALLFAAAVLLVGCGSSTDPEPAAATAATTTTKEASPQATVQDFSSVVAEHEADWDAQVSTTEAHCLNPRTVPLCKIGYTTLGYKARTIQLSLSLVYTPRAQGYKGVPPEEIKDLLRDTETAADKASVAAEALTSASCADAMAPECAREYMAVRMAVDELSGKLDAWSVY